MCIGSEKVDLSKKKYYKIINAFKYSNYFLVGVVNTFVKEMRDKWNTKICWKIIYYVTYVCA